MIRAPIPMNSTLSIEDSIDLGLDIRLVRLVTCSICEGAGAIFFGFWFVKGCIGKSRPASTRKIPVARSSTLERKSERWRKED